MDAVNGSQLHAVIQALEDVEGADALQWNETLGAYDASRESSPQKISNLAAGTDDTDAVNVAQLEAAGLGIDGDGNVTNAFVAYDGTDKDTVTLGGADGTILKNVKAGVDDTDAVNVAQLKDVGLIDENGDTVNAVLFNGADDNANAAGKKIVNVAAGTDDADAVNVAQLNAAIAGVGGGGLAVVYESIDKSRVVLGGADDTVVTNVADGNIAADSRDAVNGGQIASLRDQIQGQIEGLDGRVTQLEGGGSGGGGSIQSLADKGSEVPADVSAARGLAVGGASKVAATDGTAIGQGAAVQSGASNAVAIGSGSVADRADTVSVGSAGHERTVANVRRGTADTDAVNVGQLRESIQSANQYTDERLDDMWQNVARELDDASRQFNRGIAAAAAMVNVTPYVPGRTAVNAGVASYRGESALGVGISRWSDNGRVNVNAGVSTASGDKPIVRVGVGFIF